MAGNYRPVSLTCLASKLMESCVKDAMLKPLLKNNLNTPDQHGFTTDRSCLTNVLKLLKVGQKMWVREIVLMLFCWIFKKHLVVAETICLWNTR